MVDEKQLYRAVGTAIATFRNGRTPVLSQAALATALDVTRTTLSAIESGKQKAPLHLLYEISIRFSVPLSAFLPAADTVLLKKDELASVPEKTRSVISRLRKKS